MPKSILSFLIGIRNRRPRIDDDDDDDLTLTTI